MRYSDEVLDGYYEQWAEAGKPVPLAVWMSRYDDDVVSWEVVWHDSLWNGRSGCSTPIAEFDNWQEAQDWAQNKAAQSNFYRIGRDRIVGPMPRSWGYK